MSDFSSLNLRGLLAKNTTQGPNAAEDSAFISTGKVLDSNPAMGIVRVSVRGGDVWLPAVADRYAPNVLVSVLLDPTNARPVRVDGAVTPTQPVVLATITAGLSGGVITVTSNGASFTVPALSGTYTIGQSAWVLTDEWGRPNFALGPSAVTAPTAPGSPPAGGGSTVTAFATIGPQWSGSWDSDSSRWNNWNAYLGVTNVWQGDGYGSGVQRGFFAYGDQVANLGAASIQSAVLRVQVIRNGPTSLTVQGSPSGSQPPGSPASSGDTAASASIATGQTGDIALTPAMREAFRTGAAKGLVAVGSAYGGFGGTATPGSGVLHIQYTKNV